MLRRNGPDTVRVIGLRKDIHTARNAENLAHELGHIERQAVYAIRENAEQRGEGETLSRHRKILLDLAQKQHLSVTAIYEELVSGETIEARPKMQQLLAEVGSGMWDGVLVVEIERLARGNTADQGIIAQTFKFSHTLIIMPIKTYDPNNEADEEYFEFALVLSRREYKTILRWMQSGRKASAREGNYIACLTPFGYDRVPNKDKGFRLEINESEAEIVRFIFRNYDLGCGAKRIINKLDELGYKTRDGNPWTISRINDIIRNVEYTGKIRIDYRHRSKTMVEGKTKLVSHRNNNPELVEGKHEAIITQEEFDRAQEVRKANVNVRHSGILQNELAGLVICSECGKAMYRRAKSCTRGTSKIDMLMCNTPNCATVGAPFDDVVIAVLNTLKDIVDNSRIANTSSKKLKAELAACEKRYNTLVSDINKVATQKNNLYDLLEKGVYDISLFVERQKALSAKNNALLKMLSDVEKQKDNITESIQSAESLIPKMRLTIQNYKDIPTAVEKNAALRSVIDHVLYKKLQRSKKNMYIPFDITVFPAIDLK